MNLAAYKMWYKINADARTEYIYIIAYSEKQARFFFNKRGYTKMYDWGDAYYVIPRDEWENYHKVGTILGEDADI